MNNASSNPDDLQREAYRRYQAGDAAGAAQLCRRVLEIQPRRADVIYLLAAIVGEAGQPQVALEGFTAAAAIEPNNHVYANALGDALMSAGKTDEAMACFERAARLHPGYERAHNNIGRVQHLRGDHAAAAASFAEAVRLNPNYTIAHNNLGGAVMAMGKPAEALQHCRRALDLRPAYPEAHFNSAGALRALGDSLNALRHLIEAVRLRPNYARAHLLMGQVLVDLGQVATSVDSFQSAIRSQAGVAEHHRELGGVLMLLGRLDEARAAFDEALRLTPDDASSLVQRAHLDEEVCDWRSREVDVKKIAQHTEREIAVGEPASISPVYAAGMPWSRQQLRAIAESRAKTFEAASRRMSPLRTLSPPRGKRLRIAYLSRDFYDHPVGHQIQRIFSLHDRSRIEAHVLSFGPNDRSEFRKTIERDAELFHDVEKASIQELAEFIRGKGIDILVDVMGYTGMARTACLAMRPAPIVVNWLGFPGTMGASFVDYIIGDPILTPPQCADGYAEAIVRLPHTYMPTDHLQVISDAPLRRSDEGLPEGAMVFCCFNKPSKLEPVIFDVWMRILRQIPDSVAWLSAREPIAQDNLRREAKGRGIDGSRLVFAAHAPSSAHHIARHRLADLFLDTHFYNAHSTACDALWAGLPVITCPGENFASRVCGGLLAAAGLPELVTPNLNEYERLVLRLVQNPTELAALRARVNTQRTTSALFDTSRFVRDLETAYEAMWRRHESAERPIAIDVAK